VERGGKDDKILRTQKADDITVVIDAIDRWLDKTTAARSTIVLLHFIPRFRINILSISARINIERAINISRFAFVQVQPQLTVFK
jgi:hypothetical protein